MKAPRARNTFPEAVIRRDGAADCDSDERHFATDVLCRIVGAETYPATGRGVASIMWKVPQLGIVPSGENA